MIRALLAVDRWVRVEPTALTLVVAVEVVGAFAQVSGAAAQKASDRLARYADTARWVAVATRSVP